MAMAPEPADTIPMFGSFAASLGHALEELALRLYGADPVETYNFVSIPTYDIHSFQVKFDHKLNKIVLAATAPHVYALWVSSRSPWDSAGWTAVSDSARDSVGVQAIAGFPPFGYIERRETLREDSAAILSFQKAGYRWDLHSPHGSFSVQLKYLSDYSDSIQSRRRPSKITYEVEWSYPRRAGLPDSPFVFLLTLHTPSDPNPFDLFSRRLPRESISDLSEQVKASHFTETHKHSPRQIVGTNHLVTLKHHLFAALNHLAHQLGIAHLAVSLYADMENIKLKETQTFKVGGKVSYRDVLELRALSVPGVQFDNVWVATDEQGEEEMLPAPQYMAQVARDHLGNFTSSVSPAMRHFQEHGMTFTTKFEANYGKQYELELTYDAYLSDWLGNSEAKPSKLVYQARCRYQRESPNASSGQYHAPGSQHTDYYELHLLLSHGPIPRQPSFAVQERAPRESHRVLLPRDPQ